jgi:hypothetical protein
MNLIVPPNLVGWNYFVAVRVDERTVDLEFGDLRSHQTEFCEFDPFALCDVRK